MSDAHDDGILSDRIPCSDERCTGIYHADGRCGVCKKPVPLREGETPSEALARLGGGSVEVSAAPVAEEARPIAPPSGDPEAAEARGEDAHDADDDRVLCPDEACTGVIGASGRCGVCGRATEATA